MLTFYLGMGMLPMLLSSRAVAISINHKRLPKLRELFSSELDVSEKDRKWLRVAKRIFICWALFFFIAWLLDVPASESIEETIKIAVGFTAFLFNQLGFVLNSILFNIEHYDPDKDVVKTNYQYWRVSSFFPGFKDPVRAVVSLTTIVSVFMWAVVIFYF